MLERHDTPVRGTGWNVIQWLLGIVGGIAAFLGFFVAFGPQDEFIGLGGDVSWQVGEVTDTWMYTLMIGGLVLLAAAVYMAVVGRNRVRVPSTPFTDLMLHLGIFVAVNAFVWFQDFALGEGLDYALWVTIPWAIGLAAHAWVYFAAEQKRDMEQMPEAIKPKELQHH
ncbi:MAG: 2TM domain-containing protein [Acidimicrobiia bacterium]|nr:2TM domain-containing protein [Acidimicrobiia bacterium]MDH4308744.1 2TM domain-containing protein [Acidimicrobiia bacterium]